MKKSTIWLIVAAGLVVIGLIVFTVALAMTAFDFGSFGTVKYETNTHEITEDFSNISINSDTADIAFIISEDCKVVCYQAQKQKHDTFAENGTLNIKLNDERQWYEYIGITTGTPKITVYLPAAEYGALTIKESTGDIDIPKELTFNSIDIIASTGDVRSLASASDSISIKTSTGYIHIEDSSSKSLILSVSTGNITARSITCTDDLTVKVSTGKANLTDITCKNLISNGNTGDIELTNVIAAEKFSIERSTGDVEFEACDAAGLYIVTDTGDVEGSLLTEKIFCVETDTGRVNVPKTTNGGICEITTDTGDIKIVIQQ